MGIFLLSIGVLALFGFGMGRGQKKRIREAQARAVVFEKPKIFSETDGYATDKDCSKVGLFGWSGLQLGFTKSGKELRFDQDTHLTLIGPTGSAKTSSFLMTNMLSQDDVSKFYIDTKGGELTYVAGKHLASIGTCDIIAPYGLKDIPAGVRVVSINPMAPLFNGKTPAIFHEAIARSNADGSVSGDGFGRDSFFVNGGRAVVTTFQLGAAKYGRPDEKSLPGVARIIANYPQEFCERMVAQRDPDLSPRFQGYLDQMKRESKSFAEILQTVNVEMACFQDQAVAASLEGEGYDVAQLGSRTSALGLVLPLGLIGVDGKLSRVVVGHILFCLLQPDRPRKKKIVMFCDEAYQYGTMDSLVNAYATARAFGVRLFTVWTSLSDMQHRYPTTYMSMIANSGALIMLGSRDPQTSKFMSDQSGVRDVVMHGRSTSWGIDGMPQVSDSQSQGKREVLLEQEAQNLPANEALIWIRGVSGVIRATHKRYFEQFRFFFRYQKNPLYRKN